MQFHRSILPNGLRVLTIPMPALESATVLVMVGAGSRYETKQNSGVSHFLEHMAFKGTVKRPTALSISSVIDGMGGEFNAFTSKETTGFYIKSAKNRIETSLDVLSDMLLNSLLDQQEIDKERHVVIEEINMDEDMPARKIGDIYEELLYKDTPMGWDIAGNKENILTMSKEDLKSYMDQYYSASNITVIVAGGVEEQQVLPLVETYFSEMRSFGTKGPELVDEGQKKPEILITEKKTEQVHLALGVRTVDIHSDKKYPIAVLATILGGGMSSRLFHEVRERRGLAYYVRTHSDEYKDVGSLVSFAGVDPKRVEDAVSVMIQEYQKISQSTMNLDDDEFKKAKELLKGHLVLELEDSRSVAGFYGHQELVEETIKHPDQIIASIDQVTKEEVETTGKEFFVNNGLNLALIGNYTDRQKLEGLLKL